jgi:uncharacterized metal-binding protein
MKEKDDRVFTCTDCAVLNCERRDSRYPGFCVTEGLTDEIKEEALAEYDDEENRRMAVAAAEIENDFYGKYTRVEETMEFARKMGYHRIGIATCAGLLAEGSIFARILRAHGFEVYGVVCKIGSGDKTEIGVSEEHTRVSGPVRCDPVLQAKVLAREKTELNVVIGLCVGHDSLFYRYSEAPVTTLVAKDRVLAHNPVGALYQADKYYRRLTEPEGGEEK